MAGRSTALARARKIREVLLDYGVPEVSIELQEGRPTSGDRWNSLNPVAVMSHHIASHPTPSNPTPGLSLVKRGRSDLPGPLCNGTAGLDLVYRIICLGYANHSGSGGPWVVKGPLGTFRIPGDVGRPYIWGTEYEGGYTDAVWDRVYTNRRTGKRMTFREFMGRANAGLCEAIWLPGISSRGKYDDIRPGMDLATYHGEHGRPWAVGRKPDRRGYVGNTAIGRNEIRRYASKQPTPPQQEDDDMATPAEVWAEPLPVIGEEGHKPASLIVGQTHYRAGQGRAFAKAAHEQSKRNRKALEQMANSLPDEVRDAVLSALGEEINVDLSVEES